MRPQHYFYNAALSDIKYGSTPTNVLSVDRLLLNKPYWQQSGEPSILKKKTIIIDQRVGDLLGIKQLIILNERLKELQNEAFNIYIYLHDKDVFEIWNALEERDLERISRQGLIFSNDEISSIQIHEDVLQKALTQLNLTHDETLMMNHDEIKQLMAGNNDDWLKLTSFKNVDLKKSNISSTALQQFLLEKGAEIETLDLSGCLNLQGGSFNQLKLNKLKEFVMSPDEFRQTSLSSLAINQLIRAASNTLERVTIYDSSLEPSVFQTLLEVTSLKSLTFYSRKYIKDEIITPLALGSLEILDLPYNNISNNTLGNILQNAPNIKKLNLRSTTLNGDLPDNLNLSSLHELNLDDSSINNENLDKLLKNAINLETLNLEYTDKINTNSLNILLAKARKLKYLFLNDSSISTEAREKIKNSNPGIQILNYITYLFSKLEINIDATLLNMSFPRPNIEDTSIPPQATIPRLTNSSIDVDMPNRDKQSLDADTTLDPHKIFNVKSIFYPGKGSPKLDITGLRLQVFNSVTINEHSCSIEHAFNIENASSDLQLEKQTIPYSKTDLFHHLNKSPKTPHEYYGKHTLSLTSKWQALPSISFNDVITKYHLSQDIPVDIYYSNRDNFYYIRSAPDAPLPQYPISIDFIVEVPQATNHTVASPLWLMPAMCIPLLTQIPLKNTAKASTLFALAILTYALQSRLPINNDNKQISLPDAINDKINTYRAFQCKSLNITQKNPTGSDFLHALNQQQVGACRHRSFLFKVWMQENYPDIPVRIINNDCHSFIELKYNQQWLRYDLGGYPAKLNISKMDIPSEPTPVKTAEAEQKTDALTTRRYFITPRNEPQTTTTINYIHQLLSNNHASTLIKTDNENKIAGLRYYLQKQCKQISRSCFYIHGPEDLICQAPWIELAEKNQGIIKNGPGGKLHEFLTTHSNNNTQSLLIVNYDQFTPSDIVRFNGLLDTNRQADNTPLPDKMQVIGLINPTKPGAYEGCDFYSRFDHKETCLLSDEQLHIPSVINTSAIPNESTQRIELYGGGAWEEILLGNWSLEGQSLRFNEGELVRALNAGKTQLDLSNAPWGTPTFECFWQTAMLNGYIQINGKIIPFPENFTLSEHHGYTFDRAQTIIDTNDVSMPSFILNPGLVSRFLGQYRCEGGAVYFHKGTIAANANKRLSLYISHSLSDKDWAQILDACEKYNVGLSLRLAHNIILPPKFNVAIKSESSPTIKTWPIQSNALEQMTYIQSTDINATLASLSTQTADIIDISEVDSADLLIKINAQFDKETLQFYFKEQAGALLNALNKNKPIILKGHFSKEMQYALSELLFQRQQNSTLRLQLIMIGTEPNPFPFITSYSHAVTMDEKKRALQHAFPDHSLLDNVLIDQKNLAELNAICLYQHLHGYQDVTLPWKGMKTSPVKLVTEPLIIDLKHAEEMTFALNQKRMNDVEQILNVSPFVFLAGMSGVGKTSFVKNSWVNKTGALHIGKDNMMAWACDKTPGIKTLFIDEANISSDNWTAFKGLLDNHPPSILIGNQLMELSSEHKVIFAGNPLSYGGERHMPSLFSDHGNSIVFNPLSSEYIYQTILKSIISEEMALPILEVNAYLTSYSQNEVLITPRELTSMALFSKCYCARHPESNPVSVAKFYAYTLSKNFVPEAIKIDFEKKFNVIEPLQRALPDLINTDFISTKANRPAQEALDDFLSLRAHRQSQLPHAHLPNGSLGGVILEGEPGIGKTELVAKTLTAYGLRKGNNAHILSGLNSHAPTVPQQLFYVIPVSTPLQQKIHILLNAFHQGAVVVMDEINSAPMMERILNDLLMGQTPDGQPPINPGFFLVGTQNPVTMAGRAKASSALIHRMQTVILPDYNSKEMIDILQHKGLPPTIAHQMVDEYLVIQKETNPECSKLCFRDLLKRGEQTLHALRLAHKPPSKTNTIPQAVICNKQITKNYRVNTKNYRAQMDFPSPDLPKKRK